MASLILPRLTGKRVGLAFVGPFGVKDVARLKEYVAAGVIKPVIDRRFTLDEVGRPCAASTRATPAARS